MRSASDHLLNELPVANEELWRLCESAGIPVFDGVQYHVELRLAEFIWDDAPFGLFVLLEDHDLAAMSPTKLRELWEHDLEQAEATAAIAGGAMQN